MDTSITIKDIKVRDHVVIHAIKRDNQLVVATVNVGSASTKMDNKASN